MASAVAETLVLAKEGATGWNEFDAGWYRRAYGEKGSDEEVLNSFLDQGQALGRSPNMFFDEWWYLASNADVASSVAEGQFASGFDHYCASGRDSRSPHWLFNLRFYELESPDLVGKPLQRAGFLNAYDHFLRVGSSEGRLGHPLFDSRFYRAAAVANQQDDQSQDLAPFTHFLRGIWGKRSDLSPSIYFDAEWYRAFYADVEAEIQAGRWLCALHHYLCSGASPAVFDPLCDFSEQYYLMQYPDVADAITRGHFRIGYLHFLQKGVFELRSPTRYIDLRYYWERHDAVRRDVEARRVRDAFAHVLTRGLSEGLALAPWRPAPPIPEAQTRELFFAQAQTLMPLFGRRPIDFTMTGPPELTAILVLHNSFQLALAAIASLRQNHAGPIELILVDSGSSDEVRFVERYVTGARVLRFDENIGFVKGCNAALLLATASSTLLLNSDVTLAPGAVAAGLARLRASPEIGAVGGKVVRTSEVLQEAGCIIWRDGWTVGYLRDCSPITPEACFVRDVDFCSAAFLLARTDLLRRLGGFDETFAPAYFEDADLGVRIWQSGHRVVYDPAIVVRHYEYGSSRDGRAAEAMMFSRHKVFFAKHQATLRYRPAASAGAFPFARSVVNHRRRVLFIEDVVPLRLRGSGYVRANDIIRTMAELGCHVTVFPMSNSPAAELASIYAEFPDTVEVMYDRVCRDLRCFLETRPGYYDCVWISRTHNLDLVRPVLEDATLVPSRTQIILDTEAISAVREALRHRVLGEPTTTPLPDALRHEFRNAYFCQDVLAVNEREVRLLIDLGIPSPVILGTTREPSPTDRGFAARRGLLFVGSLHAADTPNVDSLLWFVNQVLPLVETELGTETRLTVAGYQAPGLDLERLRQHVRVTLLGPLPDLASLYDSHRIFVAPTRFAAGTPYKVYEAASFGLPVVATELLREQLGWIDGADLLAVADDDPAAFAAKIVMLYRSPEVWAALRTAALGRLRRENGGDRFAAVIEALLAPREGGIGLRAAE